MRVLIESGVGTCAEIIVSPSALAMVRANFNPSGLGQVDQIKALAAALISTMEPIRDARGEGGRCAAIAITGAEEAGMWAVKAATAGA